MKAKLKKLAQENIGTITEDVINEALDYDNPKTFFKDLFQNWCQSWIVWSLIYYVDTHKFYDKHYSEIEDIRYELQEEWILSNEFIQSDIKNHYAWLAFEHVAYRIYNELEMEG